MQVLTYPIEESGKKPVYKYIYECIRRDIISGKIPKGERLPSKRTLAGNLGVSVITVENAYSLLEQEGFIYTLQKKGYYVSEDAVTAFGNGYVKEFSKEEERELFQGSGNRKENREYIADFSVNTFGADSFPFDAWAKISRKVLLDREESFLMAPEGRGVYELRSAISGYLYEAKGISAPAERIIIGPGTEYLHHILIQLIGRNSFVAVEDPGYKKVGKIYEANGVRVLHIPVDGDGMVIDRLPSRGTKLVHISPSHHFPTGCIMPVSRRRKLLEWAREQDAYIIEDDYDSELKFEGRPLLPMYSMGSDRVIYMNTFTRTLAPSIRVAYMVLPEKLDKTYSERLDFYSGTVSAFEQYTLAAFIREGYYERHIRRMRKRFAKCHDRLLRAFKETGLGREAILHESKAGLHLMIEFKKEVNKNFIKLLEDDYVKINPIDLYCYNSELGYKNKYLICYGEIAEDRLITAMKAIKGALKENG